MSATRDKNQKIKFLHSNLYQIHGKEEATVVTPVGPAKKPHTSSSVLKSEDLNQGPLAAILVKKYQANELKGKKVSQAPSPAAMRSNSSFIYKGISKATLPQPTLPKAPQSQSKSIEDLKHNLKTLNDLHSRLRFMLQELEDLIRD